jgi:hypothetical protein
VLIDLSPILGSASVVFPEKVTVFFAEVDENGVALPHFEVSINQKRDFTQGIQTQKFFASSVLAYL